MSVACPRTFINEKNWCVCNVTNKELLVGQFSSLSDFLIICLTVSSLFLCSLSSFNHFPLAIMKSVAIETTSLVCWSIFVTVLRNVSDSVRMSDRENRKSCAENNCSSYLTSFITYPVSGTYSSDFAH